MGMEKYGKFDFSRWKCNYLAQNEPKSMMAQWLCWGRVRLFRFQFHALLVRGLLSTGCTLNFLRKVLKLKSEKTKLNLSVCHHRLWPVLGQTFTFQGKKSNLPYFPISSAQCSRCQLGCSGTQNFPCISGNCYRSILSEIRVWKSQKNNISHGCLDPSTIRQIFLENAWQNWPFQIGLSLLDFKQILVNSGTIVHCTPCAPFVLKYFHNMSYLSTLV